MKSRQPYIDVSDERGAILLIFAAALTAIVLLVAFVVDVANWYEHKRHLQTQADAASHDDVKPTLRVGRPDTTSAGSDRGLTARRRAATH